MKFKNIKYLLIVLLVGIISPSYAQVKSPYVLNKFNDTALIVGSLGLSAFGLYKVSEKEGLNIQQANALNRNDVWGIDRWAAGNFSESASKISDIPFAVSFAIPFAFALNKETRNLSGQLGVLYLESLATTAALYSITAGFINKSRPYVYNQSVSDKQRLKGGALRSFYSGHVAASAAATFFAAQVFSDLYPNSKAKLLVWASAATIPAAVGYFRIQSGNHFLTDTIVGYFLGAAAGVFIPKIHKRKNKNLKIDAGVGLNTTSISLSYVF